MRDNCLKDCVSMLIKARHHNVIIIFHLTLQFLDCSLSDVVLPHPSDSAIHLLGKFLTSAVMEK